MPVQAKQIIRRVFVDCLWSIDNKRYVSIKGGNGRAIFTSELYESERAGQDAIDLVLGPDFFRLSHEIEVTVGKIRTIYTLRSKW